MKKTEREKRDFRKGKCLVLRAVITEAIGSIQGKQIRIPFKNKIRKDEIKMIQILKMDQHYVLL